MPSFCSRNTKFKTPFGAVATGERINLSFPIEATIDAEGVFVVFRGESGFYKREELVCVEVTPEMRLFVGGVTLFAAGVYYYRFEIETPDGIVFVGRGEGGTAVVGDWLPEWQQTVYFEDYVTPDTLKGGIIYHIFPDRFCRVEDTKKPRFGCLKAWNEDVTIADDDGVYRANDFFGGNIKGILSKLDYLAELSVSAIYLSPIFEASSNHRYDTGNYLKIDPLFGTEEEFATLCKECATRGISVILDGVFNHTGADSLYFNKFGHYPEVGAYQSKKSKYYDWYTFTDYPEKYDCWWGVTVVPTIARNAAGFHNLIAGKDGVLEKWTKFGVNCWRLDVADELSSSFIESIRTKLKSLGDVTLIGEVWEDASTKVSYGEKRRYLFGDELDGVMNYPYRTAILDYVLNADGEAFTEAVNTVSENYPLQSLNTCMTLLGTHDTVRVLNALSGTEPSDLKAERLSYRLSKEERELAKKRLMLAAVAQYALNGIPTVYYGDEQGMEGFDDPINRRPMDFNGDKELLAHYKALGELRKNNRAAFSERAYLTANGSEVSVVRDSFTVVLDAENLDWKILFH